MRQISLQRHFPLQLSESLFMILRCVICEIYEEELLTPTWGWSLHDCTLFPYFDFLSQGFSDKIFNEAA